MIEAMVGASRVGCGLALLALAAGGSGCTTPDPAAERPQAELTVVGLDYAFAGPPDSLSAGPTVIAFENRGAVPHEMILVRLNAGVTMEQLMEAERSGGDPMALTEGGLGILIAGPGETASNRLLVDLVPERTYALICGFRDQPDAPQHTELGMISSFHVH